MSVDMTTVPATGLTDFRLTPFLNLTPSPWMMIDVDGVAKGQKTPEAFLAALQKGGMVNHTSERNKFEKSFGKALVKGDEAALVSSAHKDAEVPDMNNSAVQNSHQAELPLRAGPADTDHSVPQSSAALPRSSAISKANRKRGTVSDADRKAKRREQNRRNAAKCRQRKLDRVNELTLQLSELRRENLTLKEAHAKLTRKLDAMQKK